MQKAINNKNKQSLQADTRKGLDNSWYKYENTNRETRNIEYEQTVYMLGG